MIAFPQSLTEEQQALVAAHADIPTQMVNRRHYRKPHHVQADLRSAGVDGLVRSAQLYRGESGVPFHVYARMRVHGAIMDSLRRWDPLGRRGRTRKKRIESTRLALEQRLGRGATEEEVRLELGMSPRAFAAAQLRASYGMVSLDADAFREADGGSFYDTIEDADAVTASDHIEREDRRENAVQLVGQLDEDEQLVVRECVMKRVRMADVAEELGVTESRVCQIRRDALDKLRAMVERSDAPVVKVAPYVPPPEPPPPHPPCEEHVPHFVVVLPEPPPGTDRERAEWAFADYWRRRSITYPRMPGAATAPTPPVTVVVHESVREDWTWIGRAWHLVHEGR